MGPNIKLDTMEMLMSYDGKDYPIGEIPEIQWTVETDKPVLNEAGQLTVTIKMSKWQHLKFKFFLWKAKLKAYYIYTFRVKERRANDG